MIRPSRLFIITVLFLAPLLCFGQEGAGGVPLSLLQNELRLQVVPLLLNTPSSENLAIEAAKKGDDILFSTAFDVQFNAKSHGAWTDLSENQSVWKFAVQDVDAEGLSILFSSFEIPNSGRVFVYGRDLNEYQGAFTKNDQGKEGQFFAGPIGSNILTIEYNGPKPTNLEEFISISKVYKAFARDGFVAEEDRGLGFGMASICHPNIKCDEGIGWEDQERGVVRILMVLEEGLGWCTGSLVNNTNEDGTPYVLTAYHCQDGFTPILGNWRFDFGFQSDSCGNPPGSPAYNSLLGCTWRAGRQESDFILLEIDDLVPQGFNAYFNGWNREDGFIPEKSTLIHHAAADIKKISIDTQASVIFPHPVNWDNGTQTPADFHYKMFWDIGSFQPGSSGGPVFDENGRIICQLHGGKVQCVGNWAYGGIFARSWSEGPTDNEKLSPWLDPSGISSEVLDGIENPNSPSITISGFVRDNNGDAVPNVMVSIDGTFSASTFTDLNGAYTIYEVPTVGSYMISALKNTDPKNGVTGSDVVLIRKHILQFDSFDTDEEMIAGDVNNTGNISGIDIVDTRKLIIDFAQEFPSNTSWKCITNLNTNIVNPSSNISDFNFTAIKIGDVNFSADPTK